MSQPPPRPPEDDETVVVSRDETVVDPGWAVPPERRVAVHEVEEEPVPPRRPVLWPWLLGLLVLVLAGLAAAYFLTRDDEPEATTTTTSAREVAVPRVVGLQEDRALEELRDAGLEGEVDRRSSREPEGVVIGQNPAAGTELDEGETVQLDVSGGQSAGTTTGETTTEPSTARVPEVVGLRSSEATSRLREEGFGVRLVQVPSQEPAGTVVAQSPSAGADVERGSEVRLNVARQPEGSTQPATTAEPEPEPQPASVPDVVGQELADAARAFANEGLKVSVRYVPSNEAQGRVVAQAQPAGTELRRGDTVQVNVSNGAEPQPAATVPRVVGRPLADARRALEAAGYEVLAVNLEDEVRNDDRVVSQTPGGGASVPRGSLVVLYASR
jgi:eukaryotic-like serine/threonine-protein kinase